MAKVKPNKGVLEKTLSEIEKVHGSGAAGFMTKKKIIAPEKVIRSGSLTMDIVIGVGGYPCGRIIELIGTEGAGKSTAAMLLIAEAQREGLVGALIDVEHGFDRPYARRLGIKLDDLVFSQPDSGEEALDIVERLVNSGEVAVIVVDSVAALVPKAELEGEMGDAHVGLQARLMGQAMRKLSGVVFRKGVILLFINQIREKIGVSYGSNETTPGGRALKFFSSVRIDMRSIARIKDKERAIGCRTRVKTTKNRVGNPYREGEFDLIYGYGIDLDAEMLDWAEKYKLIVRRGAYYYIGEDAVGASRAGAIQYIKALPAEKKGELRKQILELAKKEEEREDSENNLDK